MRSLPFPDSAVLSHLQEGGRVQCSEKVALRWFSCWQKGSGHGGGSSFSERVRVFAPWPGARVPGRFPSTQKLIPQLETIIRAAMLALCRISTEEKRYEEKKKGPFWSF